MLQTTTTKIKAMKKVFLLLSSICTLAGSVSAQEPVVMAVKDPLPDTRDMFLVGAKIGFNYSNVYSTEGKDFVADSKFGLAFGGFISIPIVTLISIQPEIQFSQKGFHAKGSILGSTYDFTRTTSYIDVPVLFALKPSRFLTLLAGPQYSYLTKQRDVFANATTSIAQEKEFQNDNLRKNIFGLVTGVDINMNHTVVSARGGWDMQKNNGNGTSTTPRYKNMWLQCTIGYRLYYRN